MPLKILRGSFLFELFLIFCGKLSPLISVATSEQFEEFPLTLGFFLQSLNEATSTLMIICFSASTAIIHEKLFLLSVDRQMSAEIKNAFSLYYHEMRCIKRRGKQRPNGERECCQCKTIANVRESLPSSIALTTVNPF